MTSLLCLSQKCLGTGIISFLFFKNYIPSVGNWENAGKHKVCGEFHSLPFCELVEQHETWGLVSSLCSHHTGVSLRKLCRVFSYGLLSFHLIHLGTPRLGCV